MMKHLTKFWHEIAQLLKYTSLQMSCTSLENVIVLLNGIVENVSKGINVLNFLRFQPTQPLVLNICKLKYNFLMAFCFYFIIK
jgi:hypothetical protein